MNFNFSPVFTDSVISCTEVSGNLGDEYVMKAYTDIRKEDHAQITIFVEGTIVAQTLMPDGSWGNRGREDGIRPAGKTAHEIARENGLTVILAGTYRFLALTDKVRYFCINRRDFGSLDPETIRLNSGETYTAPIGRYTFVASGSGTINGKPFSAPMFSQAEKEESVIVSTDAIFGVSFA